jgi:phenylacetate-CoA ligase
LVFTTLTREATPVLRYRTGDIASLDPSPCPCGRTLPRMSKVVGRADDMLVIRGVNVYPSEVEAVLLAEPDLGAQYLLVVDRTQTMPNLVVACELAGGSAGEERHERTRAAVTAALERRLALRPEVRVLPAGTLPRTEMGKVQRVVQRTGDHDPLQGLGPGS